VEAFAMYYIRYSTWKGQRNVPRRFTGDEKMRGQGIGKMLLDRLIEEAKERKFSGVVWQVLDWNTPAINFYEKYYNAKIDKGWYNCSIEL
jgi:Acetyltransferase (GNAT) family.